jgi:hypothetical protein
MYSKIAEASSARVCQRRPSAAQPNEGEQQSASTSTFVGYLTELSRRPPAVMVQVDADVFSLHLGLPCRETDVRSPVSIKRLEPSRGAEAPLLHRITLIQRLVAAIGL